MKRRTAVEAVLPAGVQFDSSLPILLAFDVPMRDVLVI
jgi:hypothetical protein